MNACKSLGKIPVPVLFVFAVCFIGIAGFLLGFNEPMQENNAGLKEAVADKCVLEYGAPECADGKIAVPFYNAGEKEIGSVRVSLPASSGIDLFNVEQPLSAKESKSLMFSECSRLGSPEEIKVKWCCTKCYETKLDSPNKQIILVPKSQ